MEQKPIFEDDLLKVYPTHIHYFIKGAFGANKDISIPVNQVSSIKIGFVNVTVETNGGKKYNFISGKQNEFRDAVFKAQQISFNPQNADFDGIDSNKLKQEPVNTDSKIDNNIVNTKTGVSDNLKFKHVSWKEQLKRFFIGFVVIVGGTLALVFIFAKPFSNYLEQSNSSSQPAQIKKTYTASDKVACGYFSTLYKDLQAGILTNAELRDRAKNVYDHAENSDLLKEPATNLLSAITQNDTEKAKIYFASMMVLCGDILD